MDYTQEFGDGWVDLVEHVLEKIESIDPHYEVLQIKEKFGALAWYGESSYEYGTPQSMLIGTIVADAERRSETICESCGLPGQLLVRNSWFFTACEKHTKEGATPVVDD